MSGSQGWLEGLKSANKRGSTRQQQDARYTEGDLKGLRVEASVDELASGTSHIFVAKDVDVLDGDDVRLVASEKASGPAKADRWKLSFDQDDDAEGEAEPVGFVIGDERLAQAAAEQQADTGRRAQFDTNLNLAVETLPSYAGGAAARKRGASRKKELFTEEPVFQPRAVAAEASAQMDLDEDFGLESRLAAARTKSIGLLRQQMVDEAQEGWEPPAVGEAPGTGLSSFLSEPSFLQSVKRPERAGRAEVGLTVERAPAQSTDIRAVPDRQLDSIMAEPLVSSSLGVGRTLAFLHSHGRSLVLSDGTRPVLREINLAHYDELGNEISAKEAYKHLSHMFHGNRSGKNKEEKRLKRVADRAKSKAATLSAAEPAARKPKPARRKAGEQAKPDAPKKPKIFGML